MFSSKFSAHKTPAEFVEWAIEKRGQEWYEDLKGRKNLIMKYKDSDVEVKNVFVSNLFFKSHYLI